MDDCEFIGSQQEENRISEAEFINQLKKGSEKAFNQLITENQNKVYKLALSLVKNPTDAEDIAQETFVRVYTSINSFKGNSSLSTWLHKITYNLALDFIKKNSKKAKVTKTLDDPEDAELLSLSGETDIPERVFENSQLKELIYSSLNKLPEEQRVLIELKDIHGFSYEEILEITGLKEGTMKSRLIRGRASLKKMLQSVWNF